MREISLSQDKVALVDDADYERLNRFKWSAVSDGRTWYAVRCQINGSRRRRILMHVAIMGATKGFEVDHKNGDGLDCQRSNMRIATHKQNSQNQRTHKDNKSGFKGVHRLPDAYKTKRWRAGIRTEGKYIHLGHFTTSEEAAHAYDAKALELFGEFAYQNFP